MGRRERDRRQNVGELWENYSSCSGQIFEQLMLTKAGVGDAAYGVQSTYNGIRLLSSEDWSNHASSLDPNAPAVPSQAATTPERTS